MVYPSFIYTHFRFTQNYIKGSIVKNDGTEIDGFIKRSFFSVGGECKFKRKRNGKVTNYLPGRIKAVKAKGRLFESKEFSFFEVKKNRKRKKTTFLFVEKILESKISLYQKRIPRSKHNDFYVAKDSNLILIKYKGDNTEFTKTQILKQNKLKLKTLFKDCPAIVDSVDNEWIYFNRQSMLNVVQKYNKCKHPTAPIKLLNNAKKNNHLKIGGFVSFGNLGINLISQSPTVDSVYNEIGLNDLSSNFVGFGFNLQHYHDIVDLTSSINVGYNFHKWDLNENYSSRTNYRVISFSVDKNIFEFGKGNKFFVGMDVGFHDITIKPVEQLETWYTLNDDSEHIVNFLRRKREWEKTWVLFDIGLRKKVENREWFVKAKFRAKDLRLFTANATEVKLNHIIHLQIGYNFYIF